MNQQGHDTVPEGGVLWGVLRRSVVALFACLPLVLWAAGCASTKVTERAVFVSEQLPRPSHIWVYDFATTAADVPANSKLAREFAVETVPQTAKQIALGRHLGSEIAADLVQRIQKMGLPAAHATGGETIGVNDLVIRGYLVSIRKGNAAARIVVGLGIGGSQLRTLVEGFQMTPQGLRELTFDTVRAGGGKTPGASASAVGLLATGSPVGLIVGSGIRVYEEASGYNTVEGRVRATTKGIAAELKKVFQQQGWIVGQVRSAHLRPLRLEELANGRLSDPELPTAELRARDQGAGTIWASRTLRTGFPVASVSSAIKVKSPDAEGTDGRKVTV
jgi:hypothetical protein